MEPDVIFHVTGFGPFRGVENNPSEQLVRALAATCVSSSSSSTSSSTSSSSSSSSSPLDPCAVVHDTAVSEVSTVGADEVLLAIRSRVSSANVPTGAGAASASAASRHHVFLHFGVAAGAPCFYLENAAYNDKSFRVPDERGIQPKAEPIDPLSTFALQRQTFLVVKNLVLALREKGHPVQSSLDPGRFLCNYIYYRSLQHCEELNATWAKRSGVVLDPAATGLLPPHLSLFVHVPGHEVADLKAQTHFALDLMREIAASIRVSRAGGGGPIASVGSEGSAAGSGSAAVLLPEEEAAIAAAKSGLVGAAAAAKVVPSASTQAPASAPAGPLYAALLELGFSPSVCRSCSLALGPVAPMDEALEWVLAHQDEVESKQPAAAAGAAAAGGASGGGGGSSTAPELLGLRFDLPASSSSLPSAQPVFTRLKMVIVVRTDLEMGKGKVAAQACHVALKAYRHLAQRKDYAPLLAQWQGSGEAIVVLRGDGGLDQLHALKAQAAEVGIPAFFIHDAGRTQVEPGSVTVLGIGPAEESRVDQVTGGLKLL